MTTAHLHLFRTVPRQDYLHFWPQDAFDPLSVLRFLSLSKTDAARLAGVSVASVRFDRKAPKNLLDLLSEMAAVCNLVAQCFEGDVTKTTLWFNTRNPQLGDLSPVDMIRNSHFDKLRTFVLDALAEGNGSSGYEERYEEKGSTPPVAEKSAATGTAHPLIAARTADIGALCRRYGVRELALFGSILRSDFDPARSDIDMVVEFSHPESFSAHQYFDFKRALEQLLGRTVDLVELSAVPASRLRRIIERTRQSVYDEAA